MATIYKEIFKLKKLLEEANIPFDFIEGLGYPDEMKKIYPELCEHYQICYPAQGENRWISVIEGFGTYGGGLDKLEIMGGLTPMERYELGGEQEVIGGLSARVVFRRIKENYEERKRLNEKSC